ncbi:MAG: glycosyltransferase family 2 protein [Thermomicrobiales bacterium]
MTVAAEASILDRAEDAPLVSVIVPTWNRAPMLRLTLETVLAQDLENFEVLVIGDGCTDDSEAVVGSLHDSRLIWHNLPSNSGAAAIPNNTGLRIARGRYIAHLGHDDFWLPWHLSGLVSAIETFGADWVYSLVVAIGPDGIRHCTGPPQTGVPDAEHHVPPSGWLYRREVVPDVGWWAEPETVPWPFDFDYMRRAALAGKRFAFHPRPTALKFPSALFPDGYRSGEPSPIQREYSARLRDDPAALEQEILQVLATRFAQLDRGGGKGVFARQRPRSADRQPLLWSARHWLIARFGPERWPLRGLLHREYEGRRLGRLHLRGLVPAASPPTHATGAGKGRVETDPAAAEEAKPTGMQERLAKRDLRRQRRRQRDESSEERKNRKERIRADAQRKRGGLARRPAVPPDAESIA